MSIPIDWSPRNLREAWEAWYHDKPPARRINDIHRLYPMLANRCKGKRRVGKSKHGAPKWKYIYGPCRNLDWAMKKGKLTPSCAIHENKPDMCSGFPFYKQAATTQMTDKPREENPGTFKGCGFNTDPEYGETVESHGAKLVPLDKDEL